MAGSTVQPDDVVPVSQTIAYILKPGEELPAEAAPSPASATAPVAESVSSPAQVAAQETTPAPTLSTDGKVRATPVARRLAAELGINLSTLTGRGPRGRIQKADVLAAAESRVAVTPSVQVAAATVSSLTVPLPDARHKEIMPLAGPRKVIAERMSYSAFTAPHITLSLTVDMSEAARLRSKLLDTVEERTGSRLSYTAILARAVATVLPRYPYLNSSLNGEEIILWQDIHLGIATSIEDYLIVPVIRNVQEKNLEEIVTDLADLVGRARNKRLTPVEMSGSTFTISNLGMFGIESFTAIINPPEVAILAVGTIVQAGEKPSMNLTLSCDHRIVDGAAGTRFLAELKNTLENPYLLI